MKKFKILVITAHPDDAELMFGGTINKYTRLGHKVDILVATKGESWTRTALENNKEISKIREKEAKDAAKVLKVNSVSNLGIRDGFVDSKTLIEVLVDRVRGYNPHIILTHSELETHQDHKEVSIAVKRICNQDGQPRPITNPFWSSKEEVATDFKSLFTHHEQQSKIDCTSIFLSLEREDIERKVDAVLTHKSQFKDRAIVTDRILTQSHYYGLLCDSTFAEVFDVVNPILFRSKNLLVD